MAYDYDKVLRNLRVMDLAIQWPNLKPIADAAHAELLDMIAEEKPAPTPPAERVERIKPTTVVGNTDTPIKRLGDDNG